MRTVHSGCRPLALQARLQVCNTSRTHRAPSFTLHRIFVYYLIPLSCHTWTPHIAAIIQYMSLLVTTRSPMTQKLHLFIFMYMAETWMLKTWQNSGLHCSGYRPSNQEQVITHHLTFFIDQYGLACSWQEIHPRRYPQVVSHLFNWTPVCSSSRIRSTSNGPMCKGIKPDCFRMEMRESETIQHPHLRLSSAGGKAKDGDGREI